MSNGQAVTLSYLQLMSLLRTYDVTWPSATQQNLSWADFVNVGFSVAAPGCWIKGYNFYIFYVVQMAMPVCETCFCCLVCTSWIACLVFVLCQKSPGT